LNIRYITGRGGSGTGGLSAYLRTLTNDFDVLPIDPEFLLQDIEDQIDSVRRFVQLDGGNIIANSYGAYLLLQALIDQPPLKIRVLLLSPVLGRAFSKGRMLFSRPPREATLRRAILQSRLGMPQYLTIVTGQEDEICDPERAREVATQLAIDISILEQEGHMISPEKVSGTIKAFLCGHR
jgi:predicted alpha/beta hydrolase family esterase